MSKGRNYSGRMDPHDAVVTYSRLPSSSRRRGEAVVGRREPTLDATEIHLMDAQERADAESAFTAGPPDLRADPLAADSIKRRGNGSTRFVLFGASLAILAGVGVLAATVETATIVPTEAPVEEASITPPPLEPMGSDVAARQAVPSDVRRIPLSAGEEVPAAEAAEVTPPVPRPRPDVATASAEPGPETTSQPPAPASSSSSGRQLSEQSSTTAGPTTASAAPQASSTPQASSEKHASPNNGTDALIHSIEETLAKVDSNEPSGTTGSTSQPPVLPPPSSPPFASSAPPAPYPPIENGYPSSAGASGSQYGPSYDVLPPAPPGSYGQVDPSGPVPPEPVPYVYPPNPIVYPPSYVEVEPEVRKRGIVRRTIARTVDVVERVFSRD